MKVLSLFSGGGLGDYGLMLAGMEIVGQVEGEEEITFTAHLAVWSLYSEVALGIAILSTMFGLKCYVREGIRAAT